jgi:hypothetical protein
MRFFKTLVLIIVLFSTSLLFSGMHDLIILLDWRNEHVAKDLDKPASSINPSESSGFSAVSSSLVQAIWQKAAPILISSATWRNVMERKQIFADFISKDIAQLKKEYQNKFPRFNTEQGIEQFKKQCMAPFSFIEAMRLPREQKSEAMGFLLCYLMPFNTDEWYMEQFGTYFYLLIPKSYIEKQRQKNNFAKTQMRAKTLSERERILGLKTGRTVKNPTNYSQFAAPLTFDYQAAFMQVLPQVFVTHADVQDPQGNKEKTEENITRYLPHWYLYFEGHGAPSQQDVRGVIAGLSVDLFQRFLFFCNNRITTDFLYYSTCYAGGQHLLYPYEKEWFYPSAQKGGKIRRALTPEQLNYIIVASTLTYAPSWAWMPSISIPYKLGISQIKFSLFFDRFFDYIKQYFYPAGQPIKDTLISILNLINPTSFKESHIQVPVIRYPGTEWFSIIDLKKYVLRLTRVLVDTREAEGKPILVDKQELLVINPSQFIGRRKALIERVHSAVLVPILFTQPKMPAIISGAAIKASHYFENLQAKEIGFVEFLKSFYKVKEEHGRTFYIKRLVCSNDLQIDQSRLINASAGEMLLNDVVVVVNDRNPVDRKDKRKINGINFSYKQKHYGAFWYVDQKGRQTQFIEGQLPRLNSTQKAAPKYPFEIPEARISRVAATLKKRITEPPVKQEFVDVSFLSQQLNHLSQQLGELDRALPR